MDIQLWKGTRRRGGWPRMNGRMMAVLHALVQAKGSASGLVFAPVEADLRTLHALMRHDWIVEGKTDRQYAITGRGLKAYQVYAAPPRYRRDGVCPACQTAPAYVTETTAYDYCLPCYKAKQKAHKKRRKAERLARLLGRTA